MARHENLFGNVRAKIDESFEMKELIDNASDKIVTLNKFFSKFDEKIRRHFPFQCESEMLEKGDFALKLFQRDLNR